MPVTKRANSPLNGNHLPELQLQPSLRPRENLHRAAARRDCGSLHGLCLVKSDRESHFQVQQRGIGARIEPKLPVGFAASRARGGLPRRGGAFSRRGWSTHTRALGPSVVGEPIRMKRHSQDRRVGHAFAKGLAHHLGGRVADRPIAPPKMATQRPLCCWRSPDRSGSITCRGSDASSTKDRGFGEGKAAPIPACGVAECRPRGRCPQESRRPREKPTGRSGAPRQAEPQGR